MYGCEIITLWEALSGLADCYLWGVWWWDYFVYGWRNAWGQNLIWIEFFVTLQYGIQGSIDISKLSKIRFQIDSKHDLKLPFSYWINCTTVVNSNISIGPDFKQKQTKIERHHLVHP